MAGARGGPLLLVGLSSPVMRQEGLLQRAADALGQLQVRGLVITGALRAAAGQVIEDPRYRAAAARMASRLAAKRDDNLVVDELAQVAAGAPAGR